MNARLADLRLLRSAVLALAAVLVTRAASADPVARTSPEEAEEIALALAPAPPPSTVPPPAPARQEVATPHDDRAKRAALAGLGAFGTGYVMGSLVLVVPAASSTRNDPVEHVGEKALSLVPVAGPMAWWFTANARLVRAQRDRPPCHSDEPLACMDLTPLDGAAHVMFALPLAAMATLLQAGGVGLMLHAALRPPPTTTATTRPGARPKLGVVPARGGLAMVGTF